MIAMKSSIFALLCIFSKFANGQDVQAIARFTDYATGFVKIINGHLIVELDVSGVGVGNETVGIPSNCFSNGVYYHIHSEWNHADDTDKQGPSDCGNAMTGGHWDPWFACSSNSDATACKDNGGCVWGSSIVKVNGSYTCSESSFDTYGYNCEVSDFSGKYGIATIKNNEIDIHEIYWMEMDGIDIQDDDRSIVFHCSDSSKTRAFCAPFNTTEITNPKYEREYGDDTASISFSSYTTTEGFDLDGTKITFGQGYVNVKMSSDMTSACGDWHVEIYDEWNHDSNDIKQDADCDTEFIGGIWDPTHSCIDNSGSIYCKDGTRCTGTDNEEDVNYDCDNEDNALTCAIGDVKERIGTVTPIEGESFNEKFDDRLSQHVSLLAGKTLKLTCNNAIDISENGLVSVCKKITSSDLSTSASTSESEELTAGGGFAIFIVIVLAIVIGIGYWKGRKNEKEIGRAELAAPTTSMSQMPFIAEAQAQFAKEAGAMTVTGWTVGGGTGGGPTTTNGGDRGISGPMQVSSASPPPVPVTHETQAASGGTYGDNADNSGELETDNNNNNYNNNNNKNNNNLQVHGQGGIEVGDASPSVSPGYGPNDGPPHDMPVTPQSGMQTNGKLPPPPSRSPPRDDETGANALAMGGNDDDDGFEDVSMPANNNNNNDDDDNNNNNNGSDEDGDGYNNNNVTTGGALPPPPPTMSGANVDNNNNDNDDEDREETPDQPANNFEDEHGNLPVDDLGDPQM